MWPLKPNLKHVKEDWLSQYKLFFLFFDVIQSHLNFPAMQ